MHNHTGEPRPRYIEVPGSTGNHWTRCFRQLSGLRSISPESSTVLIGRLPRDQYHLLLRYRKALSRTHRWKGQHLELTSIRWRLVRLQSQHQLRTGELNTKFAWMAERIIVARESLCFRYIVVQQVGTPIEEGFLGGCGITSKGRDWESSFVSCVVVTTDVEVWVYYVENVSIVLFL